MEDNPVSQRLATHVLEKHGHRVFADSVLDNLRDLGHALGAQYSTAPLRRLLTEQFGRSSGFGAWNVLATGAEQRAIAAFWDNNPYVMHVRGHAMFATKKITPGGHWMGIATIAARAAGAGPVEAALAYARTAIALADGFLSCWEEKYRSNLIRPETVINAHLDEDWLPVLQTPPFPEYTSGHSSMSGAASVVLTDQFGPGFAFTDTNEEPFGLGVRSFASFEEAAEGAAASRLKGGIHYPMANEEGLRQGRAVGALVLERVRTREAGDLAGTE